MINFKFCGNIESDNKRDKSESERKRIKWMIQVSLQIL